MDNTMHTCIYKNKKQLLQKTYQKLKPNSGTIDINTIETNLML